MPNPVGVIKLSMPIAAEEFGKCLCVYYTGYMLTQHVYLETNYKSQVYMYMY